MLLLNLWNCTVPDLKDDMQAQDLALFQSVNRINVEKISDYCPSNHAQESTNSKQ